MRITEVNNKNLEQEFLLIPVTLYKHDKNWIRPLDADINAVFDPQLNKFFRHGKAVRWLLQDENNVPIGRIAAFVNRKTAQATEYATGGVGFFECINDQDAANLLFRQCQKWLEAESMEAMDGPINFGERDKWWGLLVNGFVPPNYCSNYNFSYYQNLFETYGFRVYFKQFTFHRKVESPLPQLYSEKADRINRDPNYKFEHIRKSKLEEYAEHFRYIYNKAWIKHTGVKEMPKAQAMTIMNQLKPVLDEDIVWFAYYKEEPVGFFIMIPELNQIFKYVNGKLNLIGKLKFIFHKYKGTCKKMFGVVFGIIPEYQGRGLEGAIVMAAARKVQPMKKYEEFEMNWIGDFNPKMIKICESVGSTVRKTHHTYRFIFDQSKPFYPAPIIE